MLAQRSPDLAGREGGRAGEGARRRGGPDDDDDNGEAGREAGGAHRISQGGREAVQGREPSRRSHAAQPRRPPRARSGHSDVRAHGVTGGRRSRCRGSCRRRHRSGGGGTSTRAGPAAMPRGRGRRRCGLLGSGRGVGGRGLGADGGGGRSRARGLGADRGGGGSRVRWGSGRRRRRILQMRTWEGGRWAVGEGRGWVSDPFTVSNPNT